MICFLAFESDILFEKNFCDFFFGDFLKEVCHVLFDYYCLINKIDFYIIYATDEVSILVIKVRIKFISFRVFSRITLGSCDVHRRTFGAKTIAKLDESIFVQATTSGWENSCRK